MRDGRGFDPRPDRVNWTVADEVGFDMDDQVAFVNGASAASDAELSVRDLHFREQAATLAAPDTSPPYWIPDSFISRVRATAKPGHSDTPGGEARGAGAVERGLRRRAAYIMMRVMRLGPTQE